MTDDILKAIQKNLSSEVGQTLQKELSDGRMAQEQVVILKTTLEQSNKSKNLAESERDELRKLNLKSEELNKREINLELVKLKYELDMQKVITQKIENLVTLVVKNPVYTQHGHMPVGYGGGGGSQGGVMFGQHFSSTTEVSK